MSLTQNEWIVVWLLCTLSLLIGWLSGQHEKRVDHQIVDAESWTRHWASVQWVTRRPTPEPDETVPS
jgi:hypothetical protein